MHPPTPYLPTPCSFNANQPIREDVNPTGKALFEKEQEVRCGVQLLASWVVWVGGWVGACTVGWVGVRVVQSQWGEIGVGEWVGQRMPPICVMAG